MSFSAKTIPLIILAIFGIYAHAADASDRPNVIIVMTDDQGYGDLSCHGNPVLKTPHLDQLHAESIRFTDFHVSPFCTPTRAALMTGNYPGVTGAYRTSSGRTMMHRDEKTVANLFSDNGYTTGMVGKWHLGDNAPHRPQDHGFEDVVWHRCGGIGQASDYWGNDYFDDTYERNGKFEKFEGYCTDVWFREGMRFVEENRSKPFLLYLAINAPHGPYKTRDKLYKQAIAEIDWSVGQILDALKEQGLDENTFVIFTSDNGPRIGSARPLKGGKGSTFEGGMRVSTVVRWPGKIPAGQDNAELMTAMDLLPTFAALADAKLPLDRVIDGKNIWPVLASKAKSPHEAFFYHKGETLAAVRSGPWKLHLKSGKPAALYNLDDDIGEKTNVVQDHPAVVKELLALIPSFEADLKANSRAAAFVQDPKPLSKSQAEK